MDARTRQKKMHGLGVDVDAKLRKWLRACSHPLTHVRGERGAGEIGTFWPILP